MCQQSYRCDVRSHWNATLVPIASGHAAIPEIPFHTCSHRCPLIGYDVATEIATIVVSVENRDERGFLVAYGRAPEMPSMMTFRQFLHASGLKPSTSWGMTSRMTSSMIWEDKVSVITLSKRHIHGYRHVAQEEGERLVLQNNNDLS